MENNDQNQSASSSFQPVLVHYINVGNLSPQEVQKEVQNLQEFLEEDLHEFKNIVVPIKDGESKVECINPVVVTQEEIVEDFKKSVEKLNKYLSQKIEENSDDENKDDIDNS